MHKTPMTTKSAFWLGYRDTMPFLLIVAPFGMLFGAIATEAGFNLLETMVMTILVIAGASQFTAVSLLQENAPTFVILLASLAVNLRMAMYSAALVPHLGRASLGLRSLYAYFMVDQSFAIAINKYENNPEMTLAHKGAYYSGAFWMLAPFWYGFSYVGAVIGAEIPPEYALDFAMPLCFIALFAPMLRSLPHMVAAFVSVIGTLAFNGVPYSLGLMIAAAFAMISAVQVENLIAKRSADV